MFMLMFNLFITMGGIGMVVPVLPSYLDLFGVGGTILGFLVADFAFAQFIFSPIAGIYRIYMDENSLSFWD